MEAKENLIHNYPYLFKIIFEKKKKFGPITDLFEILVLDHVTLFAMGFFLMLTWRCYIKQYKRKGYKLSFSHCSTTGCCSDVSYFLFGGLLSPPKESCVAYNTRECLLFEKKTKHMTKVTLH